MLGAITTLVVILSSHAWGYPSTIGHGYTSCTTCHYNPYGYGPLTDYGRALSATALSGRPPFSRATEEDLAEKSGFLGRHDRLPPWLRLAATFRGLYYVNGLTSAAVRKRFVPMQAEGSVVIRAGKNHTLVGTLGYAPVPAASGASEAAATPVLLSREHYWKGQFAKTFEVAAGFMDPVFGIRVPDHVAVHRRYTGLAQNDQTHGILLHWMPKPWEVGLHGFLGNLFQSSDVRQKGLSLMVERTATPDWVYGVSLLHSQNDYRQRQLFALHSRSAHGKGTSLLAQLGMIRTAPSGSSSWSEYVWLQPSLNLFRGGTFS